MTTVNIANILEKQRDFFATCATKSAAFRREKLSLLEKWIKAHEDEILAALKSDLDKPRFEGYAHEVGFVLDEIKYIKRRLASWMRDRRVPSPIKQFPARSFVRPEPYGVALIMSPWNYPFQLTLAPLAGAIAAGCCAILKPSAYSPATSAIIAKMAKDCFDEQYIAVVEGGREENAALLSHKFDCIFFTGSTAVGKTVMEAAARHLTPVTLELGGKSPCIVDETADIALAARRIAWGKYINSGQTCVAPDYLLVQRGVKAHLLKEIEASVRKFYGEKPILSPDYTKMINKKHFERVLNLFKGEHIVFGGNSDENKLKIEPTAIDNITFDSPVMQEEIFGPVLPVIEFDNIAQVVEMTRGRPKPLASYIFTRSRRNEKYLLDRLTSGGGCVNDTVVHLATSDMPFGGVGESGMGGCHGKAGFDAFTHHKSILKKSLLIDLPVRYPPYTEAWLKLLKRL